MRKKFIKNYFLVALVAVSLTAVQAQADLIGDVSLTDGNSTAKFLSFKARGGDVNGFWRSWKVNGSQNLWLSKSCFRDNATIGNGFQRSSALLTDVIDYSVSDTDSDGNNDTFYISRSNGKLTLSDNYHLMGGAAGTWEPSEMVHSTTYTNNTNEDLSLSVFQMIDFDLGAYYDDYNRVENGITAMQWDNGRNELEIFLSTPADYWSAEGWGCPGRYFKWLHPGEINLQNDSGDGTIGDHRFLFQWDLDLTADGGSFTILRKYGASPTPEPSTMFLFGIGLLGLVAVIKRKKQFKF
ncbi:MAG: hypothetical protein CSA18_02030 [Deltaproteobacteria bacterium]|nr:MAG: hypothetical protein CSB21_01435 [Deltaproteobacteria bacterium]PIE74916.1 MAG: hypothetical protein CSA18_02030 [Deltaproteobacteria bacterium]